jgi:molybdate transport system permease protein
MHHPSTPSRPRFGNRDLPFYCALGGLSATYIVLIVAMLLGLVFFRPFELPGYLLDALLSRDIQYSIGLSLISCTASTVLSLVVAVPTGYLLSRRQFWGKRLID